MVQNLSARPGDAGLIPGLGRSPRDLRFLPGKSHGQRSLMGYSPWGHKESDMTEHTQTHPLFEVTHDH